jgi:hypothetical protein
MSLGLYSRGTTDPASGRECALMLFWTLLIILASGSRTLADPLPLKEGPVPGWPKLQVEAHYVARVALRGFCFPAPAGTPIPDVALESCVRPDFWRGVCSIFIDVRYIGNAELRAHAEKRCRGYDLREENSLAEALRAWREHGENRYADMLDFASLMFVLGPVASCGDGENSGTDTLIPTLARHASEDLQICQIGSQ